MIKVKIDNIEEILEWYKSLVLPIVTKNTISRETSFAFEKTVESELNNSNVCSDILIMRLDKLIMKYEWIKKYVDLLDFHQDLLLLRKISWTLLKATLFGSLLNLLNRYDNDLIVDITRSYLPSRQNINEIIEVICSTKKHFRDFITFVKDKIDIINGLIVQRFNYVDALGKSKLRAELAHKLNINVCPYCNRQYINPVTINNNNKIYLGDIDHILPKSIYVLFQLSFFNLLPVCKVCNQLFKKDNKKRILNPYFEGFDDDVYLIMKYKSVRELIGLDKPSEYLWTIKQDLEIDKLSKIQNNIDVFKLNEVYKSNDFDFQRVLRLKYEFESHAYWNSVKSILAQGRKRPFVRFDEQLIYGVSLDENRFQDEILSKAIHDIVFYN